VAIRVEREAEVSVARAPCGGTAIGDIAGEGTDLGTGKSEREVLLQCFISTVGIGPVTERGTLIVKVVRSGQG